MKNKLKARIKLYKSFIKDGKVHWDEKYYKNVIKENERVLSLIKNNRLSPNKFNKLTNNLKWDVYPLLKHVHWVCRFCGNITNGIEHPAPFSGSTVNCGNCGEDLTERHNGGQNQPFNWTFKRKKK